MAELQVLSGEDLLDITQRVVAGYVKKHLTESESRNFSTRNVKVTRDDIEVVADALKFDHFYVPTNSYNEAAKLAGID